MDNRNNNGSLFISLSTPGLMERQDLSTGIIPNKGKIIATGVTKRQTFSKSYGIRNLSEIGKDEIQRYENQPEAEGKFCVYHSQLSGANLQGHGHCNQRHSQTDSCFKRIQAQRWQRAW